MIAEIKTEGDTLYIVNACCGHGVEPGYIQIFTGHGIYGKPADFLLWLWRKIKK